MKRAILWLVLPAFLVAAGLCWLVVTLDTELSAPNQARRAGL